MRRNRWSLAISVVVLACSLQACGSDGDPEEPELNLEEFQVNTSALRNGAGAGVQSAVGTDGRPMVVWNDLNRVAAQRVNASGRKEGPELEIGDTRSPGSAASVAIGPSGDAVFAWDANIRSNGTCCTGAIHFRRFRSEGAPAGDAIKVETTEHPGLTVPRVAVNSANEVLVVWGRHLGTYRDVLGSGLRPDGSKIGIGFQAGLVSARTDPQPLAVSAGSRFLVLFNRGDGTAGGRYFTALGEKGAIVGPWTLGTGAVDDFLRAPSGQLVAVFATEHVYLQRFDSAGSILGAAVQVDTAAGRAGVPRASMASDGRFAVAWKQLAAGGAADSIQVQRFAADGSRLGAPFTAATGAGLGAHAVALVANGRLLVAWIAGSSVRGKLFVE